MAAIQSSKATLAKAVQELQQREAELTIIHGVQAGLASRLETQNIYKLIGEKVRQVFKVQVVDIVHYDPATNLLTMPYSYEKGDDTVFSPREAYGFRLQVIKSGKPLLINHDFTRLATQYNNPLLTGDWPRSALFMPLTVNGQVSDIISIQDMEQENAFSVSDVRLMQTLANSMGVALENVRLYDESQRLLKETEQRNAELAIINSVQEGLASKLDMQGIYDLVGDKIREIFDVQAIQLVSFDHKKNLMYRNYLIEKGQRLYADPLPISKVWTYFINQAQPILLDNARDFLIQVDPDFVPPVGHTPRSVIVVPLLVNRELRGAIDLENLDRENAFSESDLRLLETLGNSMSVALENARLWEQEKLLRKALQRELDIGREIQAGFMPEVLPIAEGWEIAAILLSAHEVAGDFYDTFELPDGTIGLVIADVCDKGVGAALFMTLFRSLVRAAANLDCFEHTEQEIAPQTPSDRLRRAISLTNNYITQTHGDSGMFATLFFGILNPRDGKLAYINGGHEPPIILRSMEENEILQKTGPAVGLNNQACFEICETEMKSGDVFFAFTDGVPDCKNIHGEFFGQDRLLTVLEAPVLSVHTLIKNLEEELHNYVVGTTQFDDITLLAVRRE